MIFVSFAGRRVPAELVAARVPDTDGLARRLRKLGYRDVRVEREEQLS